MKTFPVFEYQVLVPVVRILFRSNDGYIAGSQFQRKMGEYADFQLPPVHLPAAIIPDAKHEILPAAFASEAEINFAGGDPLRPPFLVRPCNGEGVQQRTVLRGRHKLQCARQPEQQIPVSFMGRRQQREIIIVGPGLDGVAIGLELLNAAAIREDFLDVLEFFWSGLFGAHGLDYASQGSHQVLRLPTLSSLNFQEALPSLGMDFVHALHQHLGRIIACPHTHAVDQTQQ
jgi:hypothetical protein